MPYIDVIEPEEATGDLKDIYDEVVRSRGKLADVHKIQSLNPRTIVTHMEFYLSIMFGQSPLDRVEREVMAVVVSSANNCEYCINHHASAVAHYWKDDDRVELLKKDYKLAELNEKEIALAGYAWELSRNPGKAEDDGLVKQLRDAGFDDRSILDATLVIGYFNFVNRMVLALGVNLEEDGGMGYNY